MKKNKSYLPFIPIRCKYEYDDKTYRTVFNLLNFTKIIEKEDFTCKLCNDEMCFQIDTDFTFDQVMLLLDENVGEDQYDVYGGRGLRYMYLHYISLRN